ncbi:MAG: dipeptide ABC transporter ATP-binding protein [Sphaerochaetaceae bacterium]|jgi:peptide/nickel transport system ATP-binding protein|nr:dipeptide ABC transporter ATP-binding protein [Sphaerochaetaceae bacterium]MDD2406693.1 dipeptide ABC transporter ATP-binding protein [Sphaerochaetaceae bacterium]MDD4259676.1 dipeptide ABC transporter ATP-binding protein [Sphaerochaetaceae bacterium]MDD5076852.1 dipeptide ABC transporter ATP-binding protein [Sphaerochaetaceae bacterium]MDX9934154.1 dipeptide ABC transporter ATP-binding protein [Sphaerochaetaceae bacterium]
MKDNLLEINNLNVDFKTFDGTFSAVRNVSLTLGNNDSIGIIGESGCGKSTMAFATMKYLAKNAKSSGSILFKDKDLLSMSEREMEQYRGNRIAMVFQNPYSSLNPSLTIGYQLDEVSIFHKKLDRTEARKASIEALQMMNISEPQRVVRRYPHQISGGIQQRICIAMAILCSPDLMILDEPTTALDVTTEAVILDSLKELREKLNMSLIYISHDMGVINKVADRIVVMYNGEIVEHGPKEQLFDHPSHPYTRALINCMPRGGVVKEETMLNTINGYVKRRGNQDVGCPFADRCEKRNATCENTYGMRVVGQSHMAACDRAYATDITDTKHLLKEKPVVEQQVFEDRPLLEIDNLHKIYGSRRKVYAVNGIAVSVAKSSVLGVVGESGCGKSTAAHMVAGLYKPSKGSILFDGSDISIAWNKRSPDMLKRIQLIFQNPGNSLNPSHTIEQIIGRPMKRLMHIHSAEERRKKILEMLKKVDLGSDYIKKKPRQLSGGEQQRVAIARALSISPDLVVCDEPTSALDVSVQASVLNLLNDLQQETNSTYLFISHDLNVINYISDYIMVMYAGKICEYGKRDEIMAPPFHPYTEALLSSIPETDPKKQKKPIRLGGQLPDPGKKPKGCPFAGRCHRQVGDICYKEFPPMVRLSGSHYIYCHHNFSEK